MRLDGNPDGIRVEALNRQLAEFAGKYLDGPNSVFSIRFDEVPEPTDGDCETWHQPAFVPTVDFALRALLMNRHVNVVSDDASLTAQTDGRFADGGDWARAEMIRIIRDGFRLCDPDVFELTAAGRKRYEALIDSSGYGVGDAYLMSAQGRWYLLTTSWYD